MSRSAEWSSPQWPKQLLMLGAVLFLWQQIGPVKADLPKVRFGQSVPLTGNEALDGILYRDGILAAFEEFNNDSRPDKRFQLELVVKDDKGDPPTAKVNVQQLVADPSIIGIIGLLGTTSTESASPVAIAKQIPVITPYGGTSLRHPFQKYMINLRASYYDEAAALVEFLVNEHHRSRVAIFAQNGLLGWVTHDGVLSALDSNNLYIHSYTFHSKKGNDALWRNESIAAVNVMQSAFISNGIPVPPDSIIVAGDYQPSSIFIPIARAKFPNAILASLSRISVMVLIEVVTAQMGNSSALDGMYVSQVVPLPTNASLQPVHQYQSALARLKKNEWTFSGLEGYLLGRLAIETLERIRGLTFTSELFVKALYETGYFNLNGLRVGPFLDNLTEAQNGFNSLESCNQGMRQVFMTSILPNKTLALGGKFAFDSCGYQNKHWQTLQFGQSCTFNGSLSSLCVAFRDGVLAAFQEVNDAGGIRRTVRLKLVTKEDNGNRAIALANNLGFLNDPTVFGLIGSSSVGIDELTEQLEVRRRDSNITDDLVFGAFDGGMDLRIPFRRNIVNIRASVRDEAFAIVHHCYFELKISRISVLYEATSFGEARRNAVQDALTEKRLEIFSQDAYNSTNVTNAVSALFKSKKNNEQPEAVIFIGLDDAFGDVAVATHSRTRNIMVFGLSKTITSRLLHVDNQTQVNWDKLLLTSCVPFASVDQRMQAEIQYTNALKTLDGNLVPSSAGLEGYIVAQILAISLNGILTADLTVGNLLDAVYDHGIFKVADVRCGPLLEVDTSSSSSQNCNQCMKQVHFVKFNGSTEFSFAPFAFESCMYMPSTNFDFELRGIRLVFVVLAAVGAVFTLLIILLLLKFRLHPQVRPISVRFAIVSCVGGLLCFGGVFLLYPVPNNWTCGMGPWVSDLAFVTLFGPIFAKAYRIDRIFNSKKLKRGHVVTDRQVFQVFLLVLMVFIVFLVAFTVVDAPHLEEAFTYDNIRYEICANEYSIFVQIDYVLKALVLVWGCFLCQRVSKVTGRFVRFNESKEMVLCIYHTTFLAMCLLLISMTTSDKPNIKFVCTASLVIENTLLIVSILYGRPVLFAIQNREIIIESDGTSAATTSSYTQGTVRVQPRGNKYKCTSSNDYAKPKKQSQQSDLDHASSNAYSSRPMKQSQRSELEALSQPDDIQASRENSG